MLRYLTLIFFSAVLIFACASKEERLQKQMGKVEEIKNKYDLERGNKLFFSNDSIRTSFTYFLDNGEIVIINEEMYTRNLGQSFNLHFYDNKNSIHTELVQMNYELQENKFDKHTADISIFFDDDGDVLESRKLVNNKLIEMDKDEISTILNHSKKILQLSLEDFKEQNK